jgi:crossover junction endodeoxyribonuclease RuvC
MIILGIDPGTLMTGYGIIERKGAAIKILEIGVIQNPASTLMPMRLRNIYSSLCSLIDHFHPDELAIETAFYSKNVQSTLKIGQVRGVAILAGVNHEVPVSEYSPREVKKAVVGNGAASKDQVQYMLMQMFKLKAKPKYFDSTDALAVALCHAHRIALPRTAYKNWKSFVASHPERVIQSKTRRTIATL